MLHQLCGDRSELVKRIGVFEALVCVAVQKWADCYEQVK